MINSKNPKKIQTILTSDVVVLFREFFQWILKQRDGRSE